MKKIYDFSLHSVRRHKKKAGSAASSTVWSERLRYSEQATDLTRAGI